LLGGRQNHTHDFAVGFPLRIRNRLGIVFRWSECPRDATRIAIAIQVVDNDPLADFSPQGSSPRPGSFRRPYQATH